MSEQAENKEDKRGHLPRLETERLLLRPYNLYDAKLYYEMATHPDILEWTDLPHDINPDVAREWIMQHGEAWRTRGDVYLLVTDKATREIVGSISIFTYERHKKAEMGYVISPTAWGKGIATEAARALVEFAFFEMNLHKIEANHMPGNPASGKVLMKLGFKYEGLFRQTYLKGEEHVDLKFYGLLREEYLAKNPKSA